MNPKYYWSLAFAGALGISGVSFAQDSQLTEGDLDQSVLQRIEQFEQNPTSLGPNKRTTQQGRTGQVVNKQTGKLLKQISPEQKFGERQAQIQKNGKNKWGDNDQPGELIDRANFTTLTPSPILEARLTDKLQPWSDSYWPIYQGGLAARYTGDVNYTTDWKGNVSQLETKTDKLLKSLVNRRGYSNPEASTLDDLSPAEKYDLIVGDYQFGLSKQMRDAGEGYYRRSGKVETWMGYCHGWTAAAIIFPRPANYITVATRNGGKINLYPADIRALGTALFANNNPESRFIGGRCNIKESELDIDPKNGKPRNQDCNDTNPGTWHLVATNQLNGPEKRSFVMDMTFDYEVWNQPVVGYSNLTYYNPKTKKQLVNAKTPADFIKGAAAYKEGVFKTQRDGNKFPDRAPGTAYILGVQMDVQYEVEVNPDHDKAGRTSDDAITTVTYNYDLELNAKGEIIGGEWYQRLHPDFLWIPKTYGRGQLPAPSQYDNLETWTSVKKSVPKEYTSAAQNASASGELLSSVITPLFVQSLIGNR